MKLKRYSREDIVSHKVPITAKFCYAEKDSDHYWYKILTESEYRRIAAYFGTEIYSEDKFEED